MNAYEVRRYKNDVAFRKIFGNEKKTQILISFQNGILN